MSKCWICRKEKRGMLSMEIKIGRFEIQKIICKKCTDRIILSETKPSNYLGKSKLEGI